MTEPAEEPLEPQGANWSWLAFACSVPILLATMALVWLFFPVRLTWEVISVAWGTAGKKSDRFHAWWISHTRAS